jgi:DNA repair ATPase RecN
VTTKAQGRAQTSTTCLGPEMQQITTRPADSFFARLKTCTFISFALLVTATAMRLPPWVAMLGGGAPLVYYHLLYLTPRAKHGLSQTAIDSVYYFGFLVTISALGVSAVSLAISAGKMPMANIAFQFGLGLMATGYAVLARMHLTSISTWVEEASPEAVLDRYVQRSRELVTNVEMASEQFVQLSSNLMKKSQEVADTARQTTEKSMLEVARMFDEELRGTLASARAGLTEIRGLVNETSFVQEREALIRNIKLTLEAVATLNKSLEEFALRAGEGARTSQATTVTSAALNDSLTLFHANLERIAATDGPLLGTAKSLGEAQAAVSEGTKAIAKTVGELADMSGTVSGIGTTYKQIKTLTAKVTEQMEALAASAERLDGATKHIEKSASASTALALGLDKAATALPGLGQQSEALEARLTNLTKTVNDVAHHLSGMPKPVDEVLARSVELTDTLGAVAQVLASISAEAKTLAGHSAQNAQSLEHAQRAAADIRDLQSTTDAVQKLISGLGTTVDRLNSSVGASTGTLKTAVDAATASLETDVKRSAETARLFSERLTDVAQIIIDRTRESRPA